MEKENSGSAQLDPQSGVFTKRIEKTADILFDTATVTIYFLKYDYSGIGSDGFCFSAQINTICVLGAVQTSSIEPAG